MATLKQLTFAAGEISPALYGRVDQAKYQAGLKTCRNLIVQRFGTATNRPGFQFIAEVKDSTKTARLIPFIFNDSQTYILEFGNLYMRVHKNGVQQTEATKAITGATGADPCVVTATAHGYSNGDEIFISGIVGMVELNNRNFKVANVAANTFELQDLQSSDIDSTGYTAYSSAGTSAKVYEIVTTYLEADLSSISYIQDADVVILTHPSYAPRQLSRTGDIVWTIANITFAPVIATPANVQITSTAGGAEDWTYHITAVDSITGEESLAGTASVTNRLRATPTDRHTVTWNAVTAAGLYNVYLAQDDSNSVPGFIGVSYNEVFINDGRSIDFEDTPPLAAPAFGDANKRPGTATFYQGRLYLANTNDEPESFWGSRINLIYNFNKSEPIQDDVNFKFRLRGRQVNRIQHLVDMGRLIVMTSGGIWVLEGDSAGIVKPTSVNAVQQSYNGSSSLQPINVGNVALYIQTRSAIVRDILFQFEADGYKGNDLTIFSSHLVDRYTITDWAYQETPNSIVWMVRSEGTLLGLTYVREHQILGWHRHDTDGTFENVAVVPEGNEDVLYCLIKRTINAVTKRYIEKLTTRKVDPDAVEDLIFMDSALSYDGTNTDTTHTMTLSGGTTWAFDEDLTLTSSTAYFASGDVGNVIRLTGSDKTLIRCEITAFTSTTVVTIRPHKTVPAAMRSVAISTWGKAVDELTSLDHLEGEAVSVFADGFVVANPNNPAYTTTYTVTSGTITLDKPYQVIHVGLPYLSDGETLDIDTIQGETLVNKKLNISHVTFQMQDTRGLWVGQSAPTDDTVDATEDLLELKIRDAEGYELPVGIKTGVDHVRIKSTWTKGGRVFFRQLDPLPLTVLAIAPSGYVPFAK